MLRTRTVKTFAPLLLALLLVVAPHLTSAQDTAPEAVALASTFTYQGYLEQNAVPVTATCDFQFSLYDALTAGAQIGATLTRTNVAVSGGIFNVRLDFGAAAFNGEDRYLLISVRCPAGSGAYTALTPRQPITPAPYAIALYGVRTEPNAFSPNVIGGYSGNNVTAGAVGATIAGGGRANGVNRVTDAFGTVGGGLNNQAGDAAGTHSDRSFATVGGGQSNTASGAFAVVVGGESNEASNTFATIGGGLGNDVTGFSGTVGGGEGNRAELSRSTVGGGGGNTASGEGATVGGGLANNASAFFATIGGGGPTEPGNRATGNRVTDWYGTVGGGGNNQAGDAAGTGEDRQFATVGGGNSNTASGEFATVGGGDRNVATAFTATVGGGSQNIASGGAAVVAGGNGSRATGIMSFVGGGNGNLASASQSTVAGGNQNIASGYIDTVGGGDRNVASGGNATVAGGGVNAASGAYTTIGGGAFNVASGQYATVSGGGEWFNSGGVSNVASGDWSTVPGGRSNVAAGDYSFAAGNRSTIDAAHDYSFVWSGTDNVAGTASFGANTFTARAPGGVRFYSAGTGTTSGVELAAGAGAWSSLSDRDAKANFSDVDTRAVLDALVSLPVTTWNYLAQDESIRHIGVMAQDFYAAFDVGEDERHITTIDADGVLFAAVQGLNAKLEAENAALRDQNADLEARVARLEALADVGAQHAAPFPIGLLLLVGGLAGVWWARRR
jgi:hypothetical protein